MHITVKHHSGTYTVPLNTSAYAFFTLHNLKHPLLVYINSHPKDLTHKLTKDTTLIDINFDTLIGKSTFWHSSAHILGYAILRLFPQARLASGPPTQNGFYYDVDIGRPLIADDLERLEAEAMKIIKENYKFVKSEMGRDELRVLYAGNPFKRLFVERARDGIVYTVGAFIDFCRGPHIHQTGLVKVFKVVKSGASHFKTGSTKTNLVNHELTQNVNNSDLCDEERSKDDLSNKSVQDIKIEDGNKNANVNANLTQEIEKMNIEGADLDGVPLQRVYGISFPSKNTYKEYQARLDIAKLRDHRRIGSESQLFFFSDLSPGSCFFTPEGTFIYKSLVSYLQEEYKKREFKEVITPNIFSTKLWEQSGHLTNYKENMFILGVDEEEYALKPMNCPGHCLIFKHTSRSYRDLPLRYADFGVLHRNELSGTLTGLTRVRRFQQDDAHIFCALEQVEDEIRACISFLKDIYDKFNFKYELALSTRPEKYIGSIETWDDAERKLESALKNEKYTINPGDGAFYGPKIDITLEDAYGRKTQCATIQLDFQLPERFDLIYWDNDGNGKRPVIIHRAIFGSIERFLAIIIESYGLKLPFWISPWQIAIINTKDNSDYAHEIAKSLWKYNVIHMKDSLTLQKKIKLATTKGYKIILVVGNEEKLNNSVNVRGVGEVSLECLKRLIEVMVVERVEYDVAVERIK